jgi:exonuclease III
MWQRKELIEELSERNIDVAVISETKKEKKDTIDYGKYVMTYSGVSINKWASSGVAILVKMSL